MIYNYKITFSKNIKYYRQIVKGWTLKQASEYSGLPRATIINLESPTKPFLPQSATFETITTVYGLSPDEKNKLFDILYVAMVERASLKKEENKRRKIKETVKGIK